MKEQIGIFLKGMLMGISDLVPGISGGTIAFITGIYERLISAISKITPKTKWNLLKALFTNNSKIRNKTWKQMDGTFLVILFTGIILAILLGSRVIEFLLEEYLIYVLSFFLGLIIASCVIIFNETPNHSLNNIFFGLIGFLLGLSLLLITSYGVTDPSAWYIILGGFVAVSALFLPGISGSFILLVMGLYGFMIRALNDISNNLDTFAYFIIGAILGVYFISRAISFLFRVDKSKTLYTLLGLVIGSLSIPGKEILTNMPSQSIALYMALGVYVLLGIGLVALISKKTS